MLVLAQSYPEVWLEACEECGCAVLSPAQHAEWHLRHPEPDA